MEGMSEGHWDVWAGKIVDRYGKALSDKHFPKCVLLKVSEHHVKNAMCGQTDFGKAGLSNCFGSCRSSRDLGKESGNLK